MSLSRTVMLWVAVMSICSPVQAQVASDGSILGVVFDATGAVVPGAEIVVFHEATGLRRSARSNDSGAFDILALPIGSYSVTVSAPGFKTWNLRGLVLSVGERKRIEPTLEVGQITEQVTVHSSLELVQTDKSSVEMTVEERQIRDLPLNGRNPIELVNLTPGMRFLSKGGFDLGNNVQGHGHRNQSTEFQVDGISSNTGMDELGAAIPNVDAVAEFSVVAGSFSAEQGRMPMQVLVATRSGTNDFHGALWEFVRNEKLDAFNTFAKLPGAAKPKLSRNQFGATSGGPIVRDRLHYFASFEGTTVRSDTRYNAAAAMPAFLEGDFSSSTRAIRDPLGGQPFPSNQIPASRISRATRVFLPFILTANFPDGRYRGIAAQKNDAYEITARIDAQLGAGRRLFGRWVRVANSQRTPGYRPEYYEDREPRQNSIGLNYIESLNPGTLLTVTAGILRHQHPFNSNIVFGENLYEKAGIPGFATAGRESFLGLPRLEFTGYTGISTPFGVPGSLWNDSIDGKATLSHIRGGHTINLGYQLNLRTTFGRHGSQAVRGQWRFANLYSGDSFADFLLGYPSYSRKNLPLQTFGMSDDPYSAWFVQDSWRVSPRVTLNFGLRLDYWHARAFVNGNGATFDPRVGRILAGEDKSGRVNLDSQPTARYLAVATKDLWIPASQAGAPPGLFAPSRNLLPRVGIAWRPFGREHTVVRAGYGLFPQHLRGNATGSMISGPPFWAMEEKTVGRAQLVPWEAFWPADPSLWTQPSIDAPDWRIASTNAHEFNVAVQRTLPFESALTVSYVGTRVRDLVSGTPFNEVPPGQYANLQAARPYPRMGSITVSQNRLSGTQFLPWLPEPGKSWYNALQVRLERRFSAGVSYGLSYAFSKTMSDYATSQTVGGTIPPFAPRGYLRAVTENDLTHMLTSNAIVEIPVGRGRRVLSDAHPILEAFLGGWQLSAIYVFRSGQPLSVTAPGNTLGNGWSTRADLVGDPRVSNPSADLWFDPAAFRVPALYTWGNSGAGILRGPGTHALDTALMKHFPVRERVRIQLRWEMFNMPNHVNLGNPNTTLGLPQTGKIFSAGPARQMQLGLKIIY